MMSHNSKNNRNGNHGKRNNYPQQNQLSIVPVQTSSCLTMSQRFGKINNEVQHRNYVKEEALKPTVNKNSSWFKLDRGAKTENRNEISEIVKGPSGHITEEFARIGNKDVFVAPFNISVSFVRKERDYEYLGIRKTNRCVFVLNDTEKLKSHNLFHPTTYAASERAVDPRFQCLVWKFGWRGIKATNKRFWHKVLFHFVNGRQFWYDPTRKHFLSERKKELLKRAEEARKRADVEREERKKIAIARKEEEDRKVREKILKPFPNSHPLRALMSKFGEEILDQPKAIESAAQVRSSKNVNNSIVQYQAPRKKLRVEVEMEDKGEKDRAEKGKEDKEKEDKEKYKGWEENEFGLIDDFENLLPLDESILDGSIVDTIRNMNVNQIVEWLDQNGKGKDNEEFYAGTTDDEVQFVQWLQTMTDAELTKFIEEAD